MNIYMSPVIGGELINWNITTSTLRNEITWDTRASYFVYFSYAQDKSPYYFFIDIKVHDLYSLSTK